MASNDEILAAVDAGLVQVLQGGEEYQLPDGTRVRRAQLAALIKARQDLQQQTSAETDGCAFFQGPLAFGRPS